MVRRKLSDAIANSEELSFVFGQASVQKIAQTAEVTTEQTVPAADVICSFSFIPDGKPVRHYYDPEELNQWALNDIKPNGIRAPLWVRPHPIQPEKYELVAGLRRLKAAAILALETLPVKVFDWDDRTAFQAAISENANRRDFSALEELDNTLRLLEIQLQYDTDEVVSLLYRMNNATKGTTNQSVLVSEEAEMVKQIFDTFGKITWQSFVATRLPLLKKPVEILSAIRQGKVHYTKGILIASVKDSDARQELLEGAINESLSTSEIKQRIKALSDNTKKEPSQESVRLLRRLTQAAQLAKKSKTLWANSHKTQRLEELLDQLEAIVTS